MKVKTFYPVIISTDFDGTIKALETFGFAPHHEKHDVSATHNDNFVLKNEEGHRVDVVSTKAVPRSFVGIRVNVEDYEAAVAELEAQGYQNRRPGGVETSSSKSTMMVSPQGIFYLICEHVK